MSGVGRLQISDEFRARLTNIIAAQIPGDKTKPVQASLQVENKEVRLDRVTVIGSAPMNLPMIGPPIMGPPSMVQCPVQYTSNSNTGEVISTLTRIIEFQQEQIKQYQLQLAALESTRDATSQRLLEFVIDDHIDHHQELRELEQKVIQPIISDTVYEMRMFANRPKPKRISNIADVSVNV
jgi:hypothetical protein